MNQFFSQHLRCKQHFYHVVSTYCFQSIHWKFCFSCLFKINFKTTHYFPYVRKYFIVFNTQKIGFYLCCHKLLLMLINAFLLTTKRIIIQHSHRMRTEIVKKFEINESWNQFSLELKCVINHQLIHFFYFFSVFFLLNCKINIVY